MSIIIRLQNLPLEANSLDIRRFFQGLQIPDGGVHIVGGENGDAFIAFASDEDARQAMERNGDNIKDCRIKLLLSSRNEMQRVIDLARNQTLGIKPLDNSSNSSNYLNSGLLPLPNASQNSIKSNMNLNRNSRSPDRRQVCPRSIERERENRMRNRSRSRSPFRNDRDKGLNGNSDNMINRMVSMNSGLMNVIRDAPIQDSYSQQNPSVRSRLGYSEAILPSELQDRNQWQPQNDGYNSSRQIADITASGGFDRELEIFRDNRLVQNHREVNVNERSYTVELRNLPFTVGVRDIVEFFNGLFVPEENIKILIDDRGLTTGGALVRFNNERDFDAALSMNKRFLRDRKIDVQPLVDSFHDRNDMVLYPPQPLQHSLDINPNIMNRRPSGQDYVFFMKGLPYNNCTERDVAKFFEPIHLSDIVIEFDPKGKPTGNAYVEFDNAHDYELGLQRNLKHMGRRYIELLPSSKDDMVDARRSLPQHIVNETPKTFCVNITGLPATVTNRDLTNYFSEAGAQPYAIHIMLRPNGLNAGEAYVEFASTEHQYCALSRDGDFISNSRISVKPVPFEVMRDVIGKPPPVQAIDLPARSLAAPQSRQLRTARHEDHMRPQHRRDREDRRRGDPFADGECVILASNIPYRASTEDICVFFSDFGITEECVSRRFNDKGQPTAEAKIAFRTPEDASRAVRQMHKKFLIGRPVFLRHT